MRLVVRDARIVTPRETIAGDIAVEDGIIAAIGRVGSQKFDEEVRADGRYVIPGVVDNEVHLGSYRTIDQDMESETKAAAAHGVTTWGVQTVSPSLRSSYKEYKEESDVARFQEVIPNLLAAGERFAMCDYFYQPIVTTDDQVAEIPLLFERYGINTFKYYLHMLQGPKKSPNPTYAKNRGFFGFDDGTVYRGMELAAQLPGGMVALHCENWEISRILLEKLQAQGRTDMAAWEERSPWFCEAGHVRAYAFYAGIVGCPIYIQHVTTPQTVAEILRAKAEKVVVYAQSNPVYLTLNRDVWKLNVPMRDDATIAAMWNELRAGNIDVLGSDHVNHNKRKEDQLTDSVWTTTSGFSSRVEALLPVMLSEGVSKGRMSINQLVAVMSENPARIFGVYPRKGSLLPGSDADLVIVNMDRAVEIKKHMLYTSAGWSIYEGWKFQGWPEQVILRGRTVARWSDQTGRNEIVAAPDGRYLRRPCGAPVAGTDARFVKL